ncbi:MAG: N-6 DNA methylase [Chloroflexota bacterium]
MDKESARLAIAELVTEFKEYRKNNSLRNEDEVSDKFVRPLFALLGWDAKADYSLEEHIAGKFADIGYYVNGVPAFYVETKDVDKNLRDKDYMRQAINYSYLRGVTWAVLTDFETLMVFNAEWAERDPNESKFFELAYTDYTSNIGFEDLWLLSKASFEANPRLIDQRAERYNRKDKKKPVSEGLLAELLDWRRRLFNEIRIQADTLWATDTHKVDNAIQKFFDRLIFVRTMEDRKIEEPRLLPLLRQKKKGAAVFPDLLTMFRELDKVYNSNLFAEHRLDLLDVHDPFLIAEIVEGLYKGQKGFVQYDFAAISADVLGAVYEQYLGFKAQYSGEEDTSDKNLKRKLQGIYYTPQYVVRYIVQQTLGRLLSEGRDVMSLRVLDPACGSGAFLIEAFDVLRRAYTAQYPEMPIAEVTHNILTKNLYGVDLDDQAVEVTRLNLSLRGAMTKGLLPTLVNIKHGNSLIADDDIAGERLGFDWAMRFPDVVEAGGFDAVIGNPPYGIVFDDKEKQYLEKEYPTFKRNNEKFVAFAEKAIQVGKQFTHIVYCSQYLFERTIL